MPAIPGGPILYEYAQVSAFSGPPGFFFRLTFSYAAAVELTDDIISGAYDPFLAEALEYVAVVQERSAGGQFTSRYIVFAYYRNPNEDETPKLEGGAAGAAGGEPPPPADPEPAYPPPSPGEDIDIPVIP